MDANAIKRVGLGVATAAGSLACALALTVGGGAAAAGPAAGEQLLPDLVTLRPAELHVKRRGEDGIRLRFSNTVANRGAGPLEIFGDVDPAVDCEGDGDPANDVSAFQRVFRDSADPGSAGYFDREEDDVFGQRDVGCRVFHASHDHWHFQDFAEYRLIRERTGRERSASVKVSFCVLDTGSPVFPDLPGAPESGYYPPGTADCDEDSTQGLSIGWADVYSAATPGQFVEIGGLRRGRYCLVSRADPEDILAESNDANNARRVRIYLRPGRGAVRRIPGPCRSG